MKLATTIGEVYSFVNDVPADAVRQYEGTGFKYLDYSFYRVLAPNHPFMTDNWHSIVDNAGNTAASLGMKFVQAHSPNYNPMEQPDNADFHDAGLKATIRSIEACGMLGIPAIVVHSGYGENCLYPEDKEKYFKLNEPFYRALIPAMEKWNVKVCIENSAEGNMGRRYFFMTAEDMNDFIDFMDHPLFGGCWDVGHGHMRGADTHHEMTALGKNLTCVHIHDNMGTYDEHIAPFAGNIDMDSVMTGLIDSGFSGYFTFESDNYFSYGTSHGSGRLNRIPLSVKRAALSLLYEIGKATLEAYSCFEE